MKKVINLMQINTSQQLIQNIATYTLLGLGLLISFISINFLSGYALGLAFVCFFSALGIELTKHTSLLRKNIEVQASKREKYQSIAVFALSIALSYLISVGDYQASLLGAFVQVISYVAIIFLLRVNENRNLQISCVIILGLTSIFIYAFRFYAQGGDTQFHAIAAQSIIDNGSITGFLQESVYNQYPLYLLYLAHSKLLVPLPYNVFVSFFSGILIIPFLLGVYIFVEEVFDHETAIFSMLLLISNKWVVYWFGNAVSMPFAIVFYILIFALIMKLSRVKKWQYIIIFLILLATMTLSHPFIVVGFILLITCVLLFRFFPFGRTMTTLCILSIVLISEIWFYQTGTFDLLVAKAQATFISAFHKSSIELVAASQVQARNALHFEYDFLSQNILTILFIVGFIGERKESPIYYFLGLLTLLAFSFGYILQLLSPDFLAHRWWLLSSIGIAMFGARYILNLRSIRWVLLPLIFCTTLTSTDIAGLSSLFYSDKVFREDLTYSEVVASKSIQRLRTSFLNDDGGMYPFYRFSSGDHLEYHTNTNLLQYAPDQVSNNVIRLRDPNVHSSEFNLLSTQSTEKPITQQSKLYDAGTIFVYSDTEK